MSTPSSSSPSTPKTRILLMGFEPISGSKPFPQIDGRKLQSELEASFVRCRAEPDLHTDVLWFYIEEPKPVDRLAKHLRENPTYDGLGIGWGVRSLMEFSELFEEVMEVIRDEAPRSSKIMFSRGSDDHLETIRRWFPRRGE